eukprot:865915-Alexandrium_andersonii.AAC.1
MRWPGCACVGSPPRRGFPSALNTGHMSSSKNCKLYDLGVCDCWNSPCCRSQSSKPESVEF